MKSLIIVSLFVSCQAWSLSQDEFNKLESATPESVKKGKEVYTTNCVVCHGPEGNGDGVAGAGLNPKPRNFRGPLADWKNGATVRSVYVTLTFGLQNSPMPAYKAISPADRMALAHYIVSLTPDKAPSGKADVRFSEAQKEDGIGGAGGGGKPVIPIDFAIERLIKKG